MKGYLCPLPIQVPHLLMLQYLLLLFVSAVAVVVDAEVDVAETVVVAAEVDAAAASGIEFEAVETFVQLKECTWRDCWDRIVAPHQTKQSL